MDDPSADFFLCDVCQEGRAYARLWSHISYRQTDYCLGCLPGAVESMDAGRTLRFIRLETEVDREEGRYTPSLTIRLVRK